MLGSLKELKQNIQELCILNIKTNELQQWADTDQNERELSLIGVSRLYTHPLNGPFSGTTHVGQYQKGKSNLDFTEARDGV